MIPTTALARPAQAASPDRLTPGARRAFTAAIVGTVFEWYDYALFATAAGIVIGPLFFPGSVGPARQLAAFATFAVGFIVRPAGGAVIAHLGDRYGRKPAMVLSLALMGVATVGIGLLPTAASAGVIAPLLLVALRMVQGLGAGAELAGAMTTVAEFAPPSRRATLTAYVLAAPAAGIALATLVFLAVAQLGEEALLGWAWRLPFLASGALLVLALWMRRRMDETPEYTAVAARQDRQRAEAPPLVELMRTSRRELLLGFLCLTGHGANTYVLTTFSVAYLSKDAGMPLDHALLAVVLGSCCVVVTAPLGGRLADRYGARRMMAIGAVAGLGYAYPLFLALRSGSLPVVLAAFALGFGVVLSLSSSAQGAYLTGLFPVRHRFSGVALARETSLALVAGCTPMAVTWLIARADGRVEGAALFLAGCFLVTLLAVLRGGSAPLRAAGPPSRT